MNDIEAVEDRARIRALLFDSRASDRAIDIAEVVDVRPTEEQLLWVDVEAANADDARRVLLALAQRLELQGAQQAVHEARDGMPLVRNHDDWFLLQAVAVELATATRVTAFRCFCCAGATSCSPRMPAPWCSCRS
ncbi:MAG TPA: hypothetical protein VN205_05900 [Thermomonas sp.]|nr:hypothetical protein [Thermomonas sp.]